MNKFLLLALLIFFQLSVVAQWIAVDTIPAGNNCGTPSPAGVSFISPDVGFVMMGSGYCSPTNPGYFSIRRTQNSFLTLNNYIGCGGIWPGVLHERDIVSEDTGFIKYACMGIEHFVKTYDGGLTWVALSLNNIENTSYINAHLGYGFIGDSLYKFSNDTSYFVHAINNFNVEFYQQYFLDSMTGIVVLQPSAYDYTIQRMFRTLDGGISWTPVNLDTNRVFSSILEILNNSIIYLWGDSGFVYKSKDLGNSWTFIQGAMYAPHFLNEKHAYQVSVDYYSVSDDSGLTWSSYPLPLSGGWHIKMFSDSIGYIDALVHDGSIYSTVILKTTNGGVGVDEFSRQDHHKLNIYPNPSSGSFNVEVPVEFMTEKKASILIYDINGSMIKNILIPYGSHGFNFSLNDNSPKGIYQVKLSNEKRTFTGRIILE